MRLYVQSPLRHNSSLPPPAVFQCEQWNVQQVSEWLKGVDDGIAPYLGHFLALNIDGSKLINIDSDSLKRIGIGREATRAKIITAVNLLIYYSYTIKYENLQKLAMKTSISANELLTAVAQATPVINNSSNVSKHIEMLNSVLRALAETYENAIRLIFFLERNPFVGNKKFAKFRNNLTARVDEMVDCVNNPNNPKFFSVPQVLVERAHSIRRICAEIIQMDDPSVLYTPFLDRITLRRQPSSDWGFEVGRTCLGVNLITRVDYNSPAAFSEKFDVGDEILEVDGSPVVGWKHSNLMRRLNAKLSGQQLSLGGSVDLQLLLCKRPRENGSPQRPAKVQTAEGSEREQEAKQLNKMAWDFKNKIGTGSSKKWRRRGQQPHQQQQQAKGREESSSSDHLSLRRARSSSFTVSSNEANRRCSECSLPQTSRCISLLMPTGKQPLFRRASVWNESPPATLRSPFEGFQSESNSWLLLLASWGAPGENRARIAERTERVQQKPPPLKGFEGGGISVLVEEGIIGEEEEGRGILLTDPNGLIFCEIEVVHDIELTRMGASPSIGPIEAEWNAPIREITGLQIQKSMFLESGNPPAPIIDSPLSNIHAKIARFFYGPAPELPSPVPTNIAVSLPSPQIAIEDSNPIESSAAQTTKQSAFQSQRQFANSNSLECRTPITPNSKFSLDLPLSAASTGKPGEESSSLCSVDSPSAYSTIVKTVAARHRLAPLAEPDEVGDLSGAFVAAEGADKGKDEDCAKQRQLANFFRIPAQGHTDVAIEGLIRRELLPPEQKRRQPFRASFRRKRWTKCWALVRQGVLYIYADKTSAEADILIKLSACAIDRKPEFRTSKKHTFVLKSGGLDGPKLHFATYSAEELNNWLGQIRQFVGTEPLMGLEGQRRRISQQGPIIFMRDEDPRNALISNHPKTTGNTPTDKILQ